MQTIDATAIAAALPHIARSMHVDPVTATLAITAYLIGMALTVPAGGWLADRFGGSNVFRSAAALLIVATIGCVLAPNLPLLMLARFLGGCASSLMLPIGRLMVVRSAPREQLTAAVTTFATIGLIGPLAGPLLGGIVIQFFGWRAIFLAIIPLALLIILAVTLVVEDDRLHDTAPLDVLGLCICGAGLACIVTAMEMLGDISKLPWTIGLSLCGGGLLASLGRHARRVANPLIQIDLLQRPVLRASIYSDFPMRMLIAASAMLVSLMMQVGLKESAVITGVMLLAPAIGNLGVKPVITFCGARFGIPPAMVIGTLVGGLAFALIALVGSPDKEALLLMLLAIHGLGRAMVVNGGTILNFAQVQPHEMGAVTSLTSLFQQVSMVGGVGLATALMRIFANGPLDLHAIRMTIFLMGIVGMLGLVPLVALRRSLTDTGRTH